MKTPNLAPPGPVDYVQVSAGTTSPANRGGGGLPMSTAEYSPTKMAKLGKGGGATKGMRATFLGGSRGPGYDQVSK